MPAEEGMADGEDLGGGFGGGGGGLLSEGLGGGRREAFGSEGVKGFRRRYDEVRRAMEEEDSMVVVH